MGIGGALISGGASLLGGILSDRSADDRAQLSDAYQREFAQHGIRWRVKDAQAAGIHPLYAMGASIPTYSPTSTSTGGTGAGLAQAGQDVGRALASTQDAKTRQTGTLARLAVERAEIDNEIQRTKLLSDQARLAANQIGPPLPSAVPNTGYQSAMPGQVQVEELGPLPYEVNKVQIPATQPSQPSQEAGAFPEVRWTRTRSGIAPVPARDAYEDADIGNPSALSWYMRNQIAPTLGGKGNPPPMNFLPPNAKGWEWSPAKQEWRPYYRRSLASDLLGRSYHPRSGKRTRRKLRFHRPGRGKPPITYRR